MKPRSFLRAFVMVAAFAVAVPAFAAESIGVVGSLQGSAHAAGAAGARALKVGDKVFLDEEVTTQPGSKLQLMLNDRSTITLNPNSKVKVREFAYDAGQESGSMAMESVKGAFRFIGGALSKQNPVTIKTPVSSIGIRGGIADTHVGPNGETNAIFLYGDAMTMTNQNGQTTEVTSPGQGLSMQTPADVPSVTPPQVVQQLLGMFEFNAGGSSSPDGQQAAAEGGNASSTDESGTKQNAMNQSSQADINSVASQATSSAAVNSNVAATKAKENIQTTNNTITYDYSGRYGAPNSVEYGTVSAGVASGSPNFSLSTTELSPVSGTANTGSVRKGTAAGRTSITLATLTDGGTSHNYTGWVFTSADLKNFYYRLTPTSTGEAVNAFIGRSIASGNVSSAMANTITATAGEGTNNVSYYKLMPDLITYDGTNDVSFFDYGLMDINPVSANDNGRGGDSSVAVDWSNKRFFSGYIDWLNAGGSTNNRSFVMAFGKVDNNGQFEGVNFEHLQTGYDLDGLEIGTGSILTDTGLLFDNGNNEIASLVFEGVTPEGDRILQPGVRVNGSPMNIDETRTQRTMSGFAAGFMVEDAGGADDVTSVWNNHPNGVTITTSTTGDSVSGSINVYGQAVNTDTISASFGGAGVENAFISDDIYGAQQRVVTYNDGGGPQAYNSTNGFIANAAAIANTATNCTTCDYVHWGVWAGSVDTGPQIDVAYAIPYVAGQVTTELQGGVAPNFTPGTPVNYNGAMYGTEYDGTSLKRVDGNFTSWVDLGNRRIDSFTASVGSLTFSTSGAVAIADNAAAIFSTAAVTGTGSVTGTINGALFGPQAENIAGNYSVINGAGLESTGVYLGARP